jgi:hypothetical protein
MAAKTAAHTTTYVELAQKSERKNMRELRIIWPADSQRKNDVSVDDRANLPDFSNADPEKTRSEITEF